MNIKMIGPALMSVSSLLGIFGVPALLLFALAGALHGEATREAEITWDDTSNPATVRYQIYRADTACDANPVFVAVGSPVAEKKFFDKPLVVGRYCYRVVAIVGTQKSEPSTLVTADAAPFAPGSLTIRLTLEVKP